MNLDMNPGLPVNNCKDRLTSDSKHDSKTPASKLAFFVDASNFKNSFFRKLCRPSLTSSGRTFGMGVSSVIKSCCKPSFGLCVKRITSWVAKEKVMRITAWRIIASMTYQFIKRVNSCVIEKGKPVSLCSPRRSFDLNKYLPISVLIFRTAPNPTSFLVSDGNFTPKPSFNNRITKAIWEFSSFIHNRLLKENISVVNQ